MPEGQTSGVTTGATIAGFLVGELLTNNGEMRVYQATEPRLERSVIMRAGGGLTATRLREDTRRVAAITHPNIVPVLAAGTEGDDAYAVAPDLELVSLRTLAQTRTLEAADASRIVVELAGALEALSEIGVRVPIDLDTAYVTLGPDGSQAVIDPLQQSASGELTLSPANSEASVRELARLLSEISKTPTKAMDKAIASVDSGEFSRPAELALVLAHPTAIPRRRWGFMLALAGATAVAAMIAVIVLASRGQNPATHATATRATAAARVLARIPLGLKANESPVGLAFLGHDIWIPTTSGRLIEVDAAGNRVVGNPISVDPGHQLGGVVAREGTLWVASWSGTLFRVEPKSRSVTDKVKLGGRLTTLTVASDGTLLVARSSSERNTVGARGQLLRVSARTMRRLGAPLTVMSYPAEVESRGSTAWVMGTYDPEGGVMRVDMTSGKSISVKTGYQGSGLAFQGSTLWVSDRFAGSVTPIDADSMTFGRSLHVKRVAISVSTTGKDVWVVSGDSEGNGRLHLSRFDSPSGRLVGHAIALGSSVGGLVVARPDAIWVATEKLLRLAPTVPRPSRGPAPSTRQPRALESGAVPAGRWRAGTFVAPFTFSVPANSWVADYPLRDSEGFLAAHGSRRELDLFAPRTVWVNDTKVEPVGSPERLLGQMRSNPGLIVSSLQRLRMGGRPAVRFKLTVRRALRHADLCGGACVPVFTVPGSTFAAFPGELDHFTFIAANGRTIILAESGGKAEDYAALLSTFRFDTP